MTEKRRYEYSVLRYVHDPLTEEFMNIGIVVYSLESRFLEVMLNEKYGRISQSFSSFSSGSYKKLLNLIESKAASIKREWNKNNWAQQPPQHLAELLPKLLIPDDSSFVFGQPGAGVSTELSGTARYLFERLVTRYGERIPPSSRNDHEIWSKYERTLEKEKLIDYLHTVELGTATFSMEFKHAWKNENWHPVEALSLDLVEPSSIIRKAHQWIGHTLSLMRDREFGNIYFLLGRPRNPELSDAYEHAIAEMEEQLGDRAILIREEAAEGSIRALADTVREHASDPKQELESK